MQGMPCSAGGALFNVEHTKHAPNDDQLVDQMHIVPVPLLHHQAHGRVRSDGLIEARLAAG